jgi:hypothetical protein
MGIGMRKVLVFGMMLATIVAHTSAHAADSRVLGVVSKNEVKLSCALSQSSLQTFLKKLHDNCELENFEDDISKACLSSAPHPQFKLSFRSSNCGFASATPEPAESADCQRKVKLGGALPGRLLCVGHRGVVYYLDRPSDKPIDEIAKSVAENFRAAGCEADGEPRVVFAGTVDGKGGAEGRFVNGYYFPSKNCYLARANNPSCAPDYELVSLYPVLDANDARGGRKLCRVKRQPSAQQKLKSEPTKM